LLELKMVAFFERDFTKYDRWLCFSVANNTNIANNQRRAGLARWFNFNIGSV